MVKIKEQISYLLIFKMKKTNYIGYEVSKKFFNQLCVSSKKL